jgi:hypothetical protein
MPATVTITVDGKKVQVTPGVLHFRDLVTSSRSHPKTSAFTVVTTPTQASQINGNDSYNIQGGEVFTTMHG